MPSLFTNKKTVDLMKNKQRFFIINGVNIISYAYIYRCTTTSDQ